MLMSVCQCGAKQPIFANSQKRLIADPNQVLRLERANILANSLPLKKSAPSDIKGLILTQAGRRISTDCGELTSNEEPELSESFICFY